MKSVLLCLFFLFILISFVESSKGHEAKAELYPIPNTNTTINGTLNFHSNDEKTEDCGHSMIRGRISNCDEGEYVLAIFYTISFKDDLKPLYTGCSDADEHLNFTVSAGKSSTIFGCSPHQLDESLGYFVAVARKSWCESKNNKDFVAYGVIASEEITATTTKDRLIAYLEWEDRDNTKEKPDVFKDGIVSITRPDATCVFEPKNQYFNCTGQCCSDTYPGKSITIKVVEGNLIGIFSRAPGATLPTTIPPKKTSDTLTLTSASTSSEKMDPTSQAPSSTEASTKIATTTLNNATFSEVTKTDSSAKESLTASQPEPPSTPGLIVGIIFASLILTGMIVIMIRRNRVAARKDGFKRMYGDF
eukprot:TRINITY_DN5435_c0_g1_i1.p1 TRINITY_DN5435_c0_g1~~TRINITY_DN5435_c0_g1_i1.p1  ORF type:complete len:361 (+),score=50.63 TRINITY_DN5435_c0_g1_i1:86-1168(+)